MILDFLSQNVSPRSEEFYSKSKPQQSNNTFQDEVFKIDLKRFHNLMKEQREENKEKVFYFLQACFLFNSISLKFLI